MKKKYSYPNSSKVVFGVGALLIIIFFVGGIVQFIFYPEKNLVLPILSIFFFFTVNRKDCHNAQS
jgi:hypothetical protein